MFAVLFFIFSLRLLAVVCALYSTEGVILALKYYGSTCKVS